MSVMALRADVNLSPFASFMLGQGSTHGVFPQVEYER